MCVGVFLSPLQVNQPQTKVVPYKKVHLTVQAFWHVFPLCWGRILSCLWKDRPYLISSKAQHIVVSPCILLCALTSICWKQSTRRLKTPFICLDIRFNFLQGSHCVFCSCIFNLHLSKIKCCYPGSTLTGNLVPQLDVQDWIPTQCQPRHFVISSLAWNNRKTILHICNKSRRFGFSKSVVNINYNNNFKSFKSCEQLKHCSFSVGGFLDVFRFTLMLWRERSPCRIFLTTSLGQMRCLNVESQEGFLPCLCSALKFKSNYFYETCNSEVPDCQFLQKNWRTTSLLDLGLIVWKMDPLLVFCVDSRCAIFYI